MDANVTVDVGQNLLKIFEVLSTKLGTTTEKIFAIYTKQAQIEGWTVLVACLFALIVFTTAAYFYNKKAKYICDWGPDFNFNGIVTMLATLGAIIALAIFTCNFSTCIAKIANPEAYAIGDISRNVGNFMGR